MKKAYAVGALCTVLALAACGGGGPGPAGPAPAEADRSGVVQAGSVRVDRAHYENVVEMLRAKAPGLQIVETGSGTVEVRIRGMTQSLQERGQEPLVIVDGVPSPRPAGEELLSLNPKEVASIQVLRDVSSTSVYGTRGANGVIVVMLRKAR